MLCGVASAESITVLNPSFEYVDGELILWWTDGVIPDYWTFATTEAPYGVEDPSTDGFVCVYVGEENSVYQLLDRKIYPGDEYVLKFDAQHVWSGGGQGGTYEGILYYDYDGSRIPIDSVGGLGILYTWINEELVVTIPSSSPAMSKYIGVEFAADQAPNNTMGFDNIRLDMTQSVMRAEDPSPADGGDRILLDATLSWATGRDPLNPTEPNPEITNHFVYMNNGDPANPNMFLIATIPAGDPPAATAQYTPPAGLERDKTYFWRVDGVIGDSVPEEPNNVTTGFVWSFQTVLSVPMLDAELPGDIQVYAGEDAFLTVDAVNPYTMDYTGMSYEWRKVGSPDVLSSTDTLEISNVQIADEGGYYCTVTIDGMGLSADSRTASLLVRKLVGHWKFDGDLTNEVGGAAGTGSVSFVTGIDNQAVQFAGDQIIQIPDSEDAFNFYPKGYTMSAWAKTSQTGWGALIAKQDRGETWKGFVLNHYTSRAIHTLRQGFGDIHAEGAAINDDLWHLLTATYDASTGVGKIYVDGVVINQSEPATYHIDTNDFPLIFGAETADSTVSPYLGLLDDVRIWNYPIDKYEVADLYLEYSPDTSVCIDSIEFDLNGDCIISLSDFLILAHDWLACNIVPTCFE